MKLQTNGIEVHYEFSGPDSAPVVTLSHALSCSLAMWSPQMEALGDYRVLRYDIRGHGQTEATSDEYGFELLAQDAVSLLDALEIPSTHFVGLSLGGMIGQELALRYADRLDSLVLCSTRGHSSPARSTARAERIETARNEGITPLVQPFLENWFSKAFRESNADVMQAMTTMIESASVDGLVGCTRAIDAQNHTPRLEEIRLPSLIVVGEEDKTTPISEAFDIHVHIDGSDMVVIPGAGHLPNIEQPEQFNEVLLAFLKQHS